MMVKILIEPCAHVKMYRYTVKEDLELYKNTYRW